MNSEVFSQTLEDDLAKCTAHVTSNTQERFTQPSSPQHLPVQWGLVDSALAQTRCLPSRDVWSAGETDVYTSKHSVTGNVECALLEVEAGGPEETKLFRTHVCGQGGLPGRGVSELVLKDG